MSAQTLPAGREKRPLELNASDVDTENEDQPTSNPTTEKEAAIEADELVVKKKVRHARPFTEDVLTLPDGLQRIYEEFPVACKFRGRGSEAKDLQKLMDMYKEWAFQLHPALAFTDILSKCEVLGAKGKTRSCIQNLRDRERSRYIEEVLEASKRAVASPTFDPVGAVVQPVPASADLSRVGSLTGSDTFTSPETF